MKILVADDEELLVDFLSMSLRREGHVVEVAHDGMQAYVKAVDRRYDVAVFDVVMPGKNGIDVCRDLRAARVSTPILLLSSKEKEEDRVRGLDAGADDYMAKPFGFDELSARLRALCRRSSPEQSDASISLGSLVLDPVSRVVTLNGRSVPLRPKEYGLLLCLMQHKGEPVSKSEILQRAWGVNKHNASTRLQVCVKSLRERLAVVGAPDTPQVKSVRSFGYMIEM